VHGTLSELEVRVGLGEFVEEEGGGRRAGVEAAESPSSSGRWVVGMAMIDDACKRRMKFFFGIGAAK
jgi:hypothetical protein